MRCGIPRCGGAGLCCENASVPARISIAAKAACPFVILFSVGPTGQATVGTALGLFNCILAGSPTPISSVNSESAAVVPAGHRRVVPDHQTKLFPVQRRSFRL